MGVKGWNRLLVQEGWLPDETLNEGSKTNASDSLKTSLWMDHMLFLNSSKKNPLFADRILPIPPGSELHIDGFCLCFHIHEVAYARYLKQLQEQQLSKNEDSTEGREIQRARHRLPPFLPLKLLADVTQEFVTSLQRNLLLYVYWDGEKRYGPKNENIKSSFKHTTFSRRQERIDLEWSNFQQYCLYGRIPNNSNNWEDEFPKSVLFVAQIIHTLKLSSGVNMVFCDEEADRVLAQAVSGRLNAYLVGLDSDFCFFPDVAYIPLSTLNAAPSSSIVTACVIRRAAIAKSLGIPDELMVELAILMGNDYVVNGIHQNFENGPQIKDNRDTDAILDFLRRQGKGYRVSCKKNDSSCGDEEILDFVRKQYNLQDLSEFPLEQDSIDKNEIDELSSVRPKINEDQLDLKTITVHPLKDRSLKESVVRHLQQYRNQPGSYVTDEHIMALQELSVDIEQNYITVDENIGDDRWRPMWKDVLAVYAIEKIISKIVQNSLGSRIVLLCPPFAVFDQYKYHACLWKLRIERKEGARRPEPNLIKRTPIPQEPVLSKVERPKLPVDEFENEIMENIQKNRVTIIQGETGCGKSTRIPIYLLKGPLPNQQQAKLFISQPRRIAVKALVERLREVEPDLRDQIALRMGHGVREYESASTRAWFVTTGYLVRLMVNKPERFNDISHLIIDEVHERSVDTDILCLLCRRLMITNKDIRLILMSATLAASLYKEYFGVPEPPIQVGARRFPVEEVFLEDIKRKVTLPMKEIQSVDYLLKQCLNMRCIRTPSMAYMEKLYTVVAKLATIIGEAGTSVLIFVPGMNDIVAITEKIDSLYVPGITFTTFPIHSDIPFEEQMHIFDAAKSNEVKILIATNAAESSVTIPDVDNVICLGLCKQIVYNETSHRQMLVPTWISRASATQRAGRTGRLRPGTVWRMYARETYDVHMDAFEPGEILRIPLDSVILMLKEMLPGESVVEVLLHCLEPPNIKTIDRSFESLYRSHFVSSPDDSCDITTLGAFVSALGLDLALGSLIGLGLQFGVGKEAIMLAAVLSFPKSPWIISNPLIHEPNAYNDSIKQTFVSMCHFDANLFSEPFSIMNLLWDYGQTSDNFKWCKFYGVHTTRIKRLYGTCTNLRQRVADFFGLDATLLTVRTPPYLLEHSVITILRIIQVWVFHETLIQCEPEDFRKGVSDKDFTLVLGKKSDRIEQKQLEQVLMKDRHIYELRGFVEFTHKGTFEIVGEHGAPCGFIFQSELERRLLSYSTEKELDIVWISFENHLAVYIGGHSAHEPAFSDTLLFLSQNSISRKVIEARSGSSSTRRGLAERPCGLWEIREESIDSIVENTLSKYWVKYELHATNGKKKKNVIEKLSQCFRSSASKGIACEFPWLIESLCEEKSVQFKLVSYGRDKAVAAQDMKDLFMSPRVQSANSCSFNQQRIIFPLTDNVPHFLKKNDQKLNNGRGSWDRPLFKCIPEGARLLSVLASGRRNEHCIRLSNTDDNNRANEGENKGFSDIYLDSGTKISKRWKRFNSDKTVYVGENSVVASAIPTHGSSTLFCVCANTLEVQGGALRAEGLTLLPQGRLFLILCRFTFGLFRETNLADGSLTKKAIHWIDNKCDMVTKETLAKRIDMATRFHQSSDHLGTNLQCYPDKVRELLSVFDGIDSYDYTVWTGLMADPFVPENLSQHQKSFKARRLLRAEYSTLSSFEETFERVDNVINSSECQSIENSRLLEVKQISDEKEAGFSDCSRPPTIELDEHVKIASKALFATSLSPGEEPGENDLPSSNILAIIIEQARRIINPKDKRKITLESSEWEISKFSLESSVWYRAVFTAADVPYVKRTSNNDPAWLKHDDHTKARPHTIAAARSCIPPAVSMHAKETKIAGNDILVFATIQHAVQMESAFWLERQFKVGKKHWYQQHDINNLARQLAGKMKKNMKSKQKTKSTKSSPKRKNKNRVEATKD